MSDARDAYDAAMKRLTAEEAIDHLLAVHWVADRKNPYENINAIIDQIVREHMDPSVSSAAQALIDRGRQEMLAELMTGEKQA